MITLDGTNSSSVYAVELERIDVHLSIALLAQYLAQPRRGHLHQVFHAFAYLKTHARSRIVLDPTLPFVDEQSFIEGDWTEFYVGAKQYHLMLQNLEEKR